MNLGGFPGGTADKPPHSQCRGPGLCRRENQGTERLSNTEVVNKDRAQSPCVLCQCPSHCPTQHSKALEKDLGSGGTQVCAKGHSCKSSVFFRAHIHTEMGRERYRKLNRLLCGLLVFFFTSLRSLTVCRHEPASVLSVAAESRTV